MRLARYSPKAVYVPGKYLVVADALSRSPLSSYSTGELEQEVEAYVSAALASVPATNNKMEVIK